MKSNSVQDNWRAQHPRVKDLRGQVSGRLTVTAFSGIDKNGKALWECRCACGATVIVRSDFLKGKQVSCGCSMREGMEVTIGGKRVR